MHKVRLIIFATLVTFTISSCSNGNVSTKTEEKQPQEISTTTQEKEEQQTIDIKTEEEYEKLSPRIVLTAENFNQNWEYIKDDALTDLDGSYIISDCIEPNKDQIITSYSDGYAQIESEYLAATSAVTFYNSSDTAKEVVNQLQKQSQNQCIKNEYKSFLENHEVKVEKIKLSKLDNVNFNDLNGYAIDIESTYSPYIESEVNNSELKYIEKMHFIIFQYKNSVIKLSTLKMILNSDQENNEPDFQTEQDEQLLKTLIEKAKTKI